MTLKTALINFCSRQKQKREQTGSLKQPENNDHSQCSQRSQQNLYHFVETTFSITPQLIIDNFLSTDDEQDILNGDVKESCLTAHIKAWIQTGTPTISGKNTNSKGNQHER